MKNCRRFLKLLRRHAVLEAVLVILILFMSTVQALPLAKADTTADATSSVAPEAQAAEPPTDSHPKVTARASADQDTDIEFASQRVKLHVPAGAVNQDVDIAMIDQGPWGPHGGGMLDVLELHAFTVGSVPTAEVHQFNKGLTLTIQFGPKELQGIDLDTLQLCSLDEQTREWVPLPVYSFGRDTRTMTGILEHFSNVGLKGNPLILGPGRVLAFQVGLQSGAAIASYSIEVPPGAGGFQPSIQLVYNSASVDEMKSKRSVGSWVGIGWSLELGSISCDPLTNEMFLNLNGQRYQLIWNYSDGSYHTIPESFYKVWASGLGGYNVWDRDGNYYQFGGTSDSVQYYDSHDGRKTIYRYDLNLMQDTSDNSISITYVQDKWTDTNNYEHVRSAYPDYISYNNDQAEIHFYSDHAGGSGLLRPDNPIQPTPKVVENRRLTVMGCYIKQGGVWKTVREYWFAYNTTPCYQSPDPNIYYAGRHTLTSITEKDSMGQALPAMTFSYSNPELTIYHYDNDQSQNNGDPGNPAILTWPYLTSVANGYGATTTYSYVSNPALPANPSSPPSNWAYSHVWTREVVSTKTINPAPGIEPAQTSTYLYRGNPQYAKVDPAPQGWNNQFRGFNQVRETDAQGNYVEHYFFTTGTSDEDLLSGQEFRTEWYSSAGSLLDKKEYTWADRYHSSSENTPSPTGDHLVGYWKFDDVTGSTVYDTAGNNHGTRSGPTFTKDSMSGTALSFSGSSNRVDCGNDSSLSFGAGDFSIEFWIKYTGSTTINQAFDILGKTTSKQNTPGFIAQVTTWGDNGSNYGILFSTTNGTWGTGNVEDQGHYVPNIWYHVVGVRSGSTWTIYVNGAYSTSASGGSRGANVNNSTNFKIGQVFSADTALTGMLDGVRLYNRALSFNEVNEVAAHYNDYNNRPKAQWRLDEGTGSTAYDTAGSNDGTRSSGTSWSTYSVSGWALDFNNAQDNVDCGSDNSLNFGTGDFSVELWLRYWGDTTINTFYDILGKANSNHNTPGFIVRVTNYGGSGSNYGILFSTTNGDWGTGNVEHWASYETSTWYHIVCVRSGYVLKIYQNGALVASRNIGKVDNVNNSVHFKMGKATDASTSTMTLDEVQLYNRALSDTEILQHAQLWSPFAYLKQATDTMGTKTSRTSYVPDDYGNIITQYEDGDISISTDNVVIERDFHPNASTNIVDKVAAERVKDYTGALKKKTEYYYDNHNVDVPPDLGRLTRLEEYVDTSTSVSTYYTYDSWGNVVQKTDPKGNVWQTSYDTTYHTFPQTVTYPISGLSESYSFDPGTGNLLSVTDVNGQVTSYEYDTFGRVTKVIKPGDSSASPTIQYQYNNWGTLGQQHVKTLTKATASDILWQSQYFDGLGRVIQTQSRGETGRTIIDSTTTYNNRGLVYQEYVSQDLDSTQVNGYKTPDSGWKYVCYTYDGLGRTTSIKAADDTYTNIDCSVPWQETVTNPRTYKHKYYYDAFGRLTKVEELNASQAVYATTTYSYDVLGNLKQVVDNSGNTSTMGYDWLSRKTSMSDPDMGSWSYHYDNNGNLSSQTDAKGQTITFTYDALNRLTGKTYPAGSGMTNVTYTYDDTSGGNYGKGHRTSMTDASGPTYYKYDARGRLVQEQLGSGWPICMPTVYGYDSADRLTMITFPNTGETITQTYNGRGLPYTLSSSAVGSLVTGTTYNQLAEVTQINLGNGDITIYGYWGVGGPNDNPGGYYGRLWRIKTYTPGQPPQPDVVLQNTTYTWDANGNLYQRQDVLAGQTETFVYDFLDRLTSVSGPYGKTFTYNQIGNITLMNGYSYTYGSKPHAVTAVGSTTYAYDANGNMTTRGSQTLTWDVENRLVSVSGGGASMSATYDGDGNRVWKTENGQTVLYLNRYFEFDWSTGVYNTHYYLGDQEIAYKNSNGLRYVSQDSLGSTVLTTDNSGGTVATVKYYPYGDCRNSQGYLDTDKRFTGQRLDQTGLYFYNARYYDATIGRFISPDTIVPDWTNPQAWNSYSYCLNNPLKYTDLTGNWPHIHWGTVLKVIAAVAVVTLVAVVAVVAAPVVLPALSGALVGGGSITIGGATTAAVAAYSAAAAIGATMAVAPIVSSIDEPLFQSNDSAANSGLNAAGGHVASTPPNGPNKRDYLLSQVENQKLRNTVDQLYRPGAQVGDGGTADIIRAEETGEHIDKGIERFTNLEKIMMRENLNPTDRGIAEDLYQDLMDALVKTGVPR